MEDEPRRTRSDAGEQGRGYVHPVQLYASLLGLGLFMWLASWRPTRPGSRFCAFLASYGVARFIMEGLRGDFRPVLGPFSLPQVFSFLFVVAGLGVWLRFVQGTHGAVRCSVVGVQGSPTIG